MNATPYLHLLWKEYRAIRLFWISIVVLAVVFGWLISLIPFDGDRSTATLILFNFALAAPVLFAAGCAGTSFAMEKEERTFEFLRSSPITSGQVFASKLSMALLATLAMFLLLWPFAMYVSRHGELAPPQLADLHGLWLVAAAEAIAWGTLFSLLTARPLWAVVLTFAAGSTAAHIVTALTHHADYKLSSYAAAAPARLGVAGIVLIIDLILGSRWLDNPTARVQPLSRGKTQWFAFLRNPVWMSDRSHRIMLRRLLWQTRRRSLWLAIGLSLLYIVVALIFLGFAAQGIAPRYVQASPVIALAVVVASLMGSFVFLQDQERHQFRFFREHNVPPRYVWLARQLPWMLTLLVSTFIVWLILPRYFYGLAAAPMTGEAVYESIVIPLVAILLAYAAGQWTSMLVRSGLMAGFFGLLLTGALCLWLTLMHFVGASLTWFVLPIPVILLWATWLRAPDWILEKTTWAARGRAAAAVLVPAVSIGIGLAIFRVHQIPLVEPGFDPQQFVEEIRARLPEGRITADLYRRASDLYVRPHSELNLGPPATPEQLAWLDENREALKLVLEASDRPICIFFDPSREAEIPELKNGSVLPQLVQASGHPLQAEGKLNEALDRYFAAFRSIGQLAPVNEGMTRSLLAVNFAEFPTWAADKLQTPQQIGAAIKRLAALRSDTLQPENRLKANYLMLSRSILAGEGLRPYWKYYGEANSAQITREVFFGRAMPWENHRAARLLNLITAEDLQLLQTVQLQLETQEQAGPGEAFGVVSLLIQFGDNLKPPGVLALTDRKKTEWADTTIPKFSTIGSLAHALALEFVEFKARQRGTQIVMALQAYRLEHGELPVSLEQLQGEYFDVLPKDPYSGGMFRYFPRGLPLPPRSEFPDQTQAVIGADEVQSPDRAGDAAATATPQEFASELERWQQNSPDIVPNTPGVWCTGPGIFEAGGEPDTFYWLMADGTGTPVYPSYSAWGSGFWFPIPEPQH